MSDTSIVSELLLKLYALSGESPIDEFQDAALGLLKGSLAFDSCMWGTAVSTPVGIDIRTLHLHEQGAEMIENYDRLKHQDVAAQSVVGHRRVTRRFNAEHTFAGKPGREFRDFLRRFEIENLIITAADDARTGHVEWVSLFRADPEAQCRHEEQALMDLLSPHLMQALRFNRARHLQELGRRDGLLHRPGAVADMHGRISHGEPGFDALLREEWQDWNGAPLPPRALAQVLGTGEHLGRTLQLRGRAQHGLLFLRARPRCKADALSPRERAVAGLAVRGCTHKEIAQLLGRSPATVRNQMQSVYDKLEVGNAAMLSEEMRRAE